MSTEPEPSPFPISALRDLCQRAAPAHPASDQLEDWLSRWSAHISLGHHCLQLTENEGDHLRTHPAFSDDRCHAPFVIDSKNRLYLYRHYREEALLATALRSRLSSDENVGASSLEEEALQRPLTVLAGGPGTGKTYTLASIAGAFLAKEPSRQSLVVAAPTGKAASRLEETLRSHGISDIKPTTIHRLLSARSAGGFRSSETNPLAADVTIIDEASMLDTQLLAQLLRALPAYARLVLCGDPDQLPAVGLGAPFATLVEYMRAHRHPDLHELSQAHRFGDPDLSRLADHIRHGDRSGLLDLAARGERLKILPLPAPETLPAFLSRELNHHCPNRTGIADTSHALASLRTRVLLTPIHHSDYGTRALNDAARRTFFPRRTTDPQPGLPVIITENAYDAHLYNGDTGILVERENHRLFFATEEDPLPPREVTFQALPAWLPAYAITVHRSQGSEYDHVTLFLPKEAAEHLDRRLLFTAVTRARQSVTIYTDNDTLSQSLRAPAPLETGLADRLRA